MRLLADLHRHLAEHPAAPVPAGLRAELLRALAAIDQGADLRAAFGNGDHARGRAALRRAAELAAPDASPWLQAGALEGRLRAFLRVWPRIQSGSRAPADEVEQALAVALACGDWPTTQRRLYELLRH